MSDHEAAYIFGYERAMCDDFSDNGYRIGSTCHTAFMAGYKQGIKEFDE
jgi:hypothetical protein